MPLDGVVSGRDLNVLTMGRLKELPQYDFTIMLTGLFMAPSSDTYIFYTASDDASYLWLDTNEPNNFTYAKWLQPSSWSLNDAVVKNPGLHATTIEKSTPMLLRGGTYYPIYMVYGQLYGGANFQVWCQTTSGMKMSDFGGNWFNNA